jgi:hypothetical protein
MLLTSAILGTIDGQVAQKSVVHISQITMIIAANISLILLAELLVVVVDQETLSVGEA